MSIIEKAEANCKNCYKCVRVCPVKSVKVAKGATEVVAERCIVCGECIVACPQHAKAAVDGLSGVKELISSSGTVIASVAPSFAGVWGPGSWKRLNEALLALGFTAAHSTVEGAAVVGAAFRDYCSVALESGKAVISTACPVVVELVRRYYPELVGLLSPIVSPMIAHSRMLKQEYGDRVSVVFIGPCPGKKREGEGILEGVLSFGELKTWLRDAGLSIAYRETDTQRSQDSIITAAKRFPLPGGMFDSAGLSENGEGLIVVDGLDNITEVLNDLAQGSCKGIVLEALACNGGCVNGPLIRQFGSSYSRKEGVVRASRGAGGVRLDSIRLAIGVVDVSAEYRSADLDVKEPSDEAIQNVLNMTGKRQRSDELNCGACGYRSCREKAAAVCQGMADPAMCMPYMESRAESISNLVIDSTPNGIIVTDLEMNIQEFNPAAERMFIRRREDVLGCSLDSVINTENFNLVAQSGEPIINKKVQYPKYGLVTTQTISIVSEHSLVLGLFTDISNDEKREEELSKVKAETLDKAQEVINKQMYVVQEIAGLLGETAAESKLLLTSLMKLVQGDGGEGR